MSVEELLKVVSLVFIPSTGAVVWLLSQVYGLRGDLREIQAILRHDQESMHRRTLKIEADLAALTDTMRELTIDIARHGKSPTHTRN